MRAQSLFVLCCPHAVLLTIFKCIQKFSFGYRRKKTNVSKLFFVFFGGDLSFWFLKFLESRTPRVYIFPSHVSCITHRRDFSTRRCTRTQMSWIFIFGGEMRKRIWRNERTSCGASSISVMSFSGRTRNRRNLINTKTTHTHIQTPLVDFIVYATPFARRRRCLKIKIFSQKTKMFNSFFKGNR